MRVYAYTIYIRTAHQTRLAHNTIHVMSSLTILQYRDDLIEEETTEVDSETGVLQGPMVVEVVRPLIPVDLVEVRVCEDALTVICLDGFEHTCSDDSLVLFLFLLLLHFAI